MPNFDITIYQKPHSRGQAADPSGFTQAFEIKAGDTAALAAAVLYDNCPAQYRGGYRSGTNFERANCVMGDTDNSHSDDPAAWVTHEDIAAKLPGVAFYSYPSRNHMKPKDGKAPRPKEHHIFPEETIKDAREYATLMERLIQTFPELHFDGIVKSPAQLNFGVESPQVIYTPGTMNLSEYLKNFCSNLSESNAARIRRILAVGLPIPEGERDNTLNVGALCLIKRHGGDTEDARQEYDRLVSLCDGELDPGQPEKCYKSALGKFEKDIKNSPDYDPDKYTETDFDDLRKLDAKRCYFDPLYVVVTYLPEKASKVKDKETCRLADYTGDKDLIISAVPLPVEENMVLLLRHYGLTLKFNEIKQSPEVWKCGEKQGQLQLFYSHIRDLCDKQVFKMPVSKFDDMLLSIARRNRYNPFADYLTECEKVYDGKDYIGELSATIVSTLPEPVKRKYITRFLLQMDYVATSADGDETAQHHMLTLKGKQGDGKSAWLNAILPEPFRRDNYFLPGRTCDLKNKDHILEQSTALLTEWAEIAATFRKSDQEEIKAYITRKVDRLRPPYFKEAIDIKRRMCLCATVNDDEFLRDTTGDRRYTVIPCIDINYQHSVNINGVWGQIHRMKLQGAPYWYSKDEILDVMNANSEHRVKSDLQFTLETLYDLFPEAEPEKPIFAKDIMAGYEFSQLTRKMTVTTKSITQALKALGVKYKEIQRVAAFYITPRGANSSTFYTPCNDESEEFLA